MAIFKLEIADGDVDRVFDAVCVNYGRTEHIHNPNHTDDNEEPEMIENPETKGDFTHKIVRRFLSDNVVAHENAAAKKAAVAGIDTSVGLSDPEA